MFKREEAAMSKESKALERQAWDAKRVGNLSLIHI